MAPLHVEQSRAAVQRGVAPAPIKAKRDKRHEQRRRAPVSPDSRGLAAPPDPLHSPRPDTVVLGREFEQLLLQAGGRLLDLGRARPRDARGPEQERDAHV